MRFLLFFIFVLPFIKVVALEEILLSDKRGDTFLDILNDKKRVEALLERKDSLFGATIDRCPKMISVFDFSGQEKSRDYYHYSTDILMTLMTKEFNKATNYKIVKDLTEIKLILRINLDGFLDKIELYDVYPYKVLRNAKEYGELQKILDQIKYQFKAVDVEHKCAQYELFINASWNMYEETTKEVNN